MIRAEGHQITQSIHITDKVAGQKAVDWLDVAYFIMRVVAAHGASLGPTRFAVGCARQAANLGGILLYRFRS